MPLFFLRFAIPVVIVAGISFAAWKLYQVNQEKVSAQTPGAGSEALLEKTASSPSKPPQKSKVTSELANNALNPSSSEPVVPKSFTEQKTESLPQKESVPQLVRALKNDDPTERQRAAAALHSLGTEAKEAIPALREALKDRDQDVQMWAALALVNNQEYDKGVIPVLVLALQHENPVLRQVACLSLGLIPYSESEKEPVVPALAETAGKDGNEDVRKAAASALSIIAPETIGKTAAK
jgi:HEAT repeat protein